MMSEDELFTDQMIVIDNAGDVTIGVASSANLAGDVADVVTFLADLAGVVTANVTSAAASDDVVLSDCE